MVVSILELGRVRQGGDRRTALDEARTLAQHAETWGYRRFWVAEHHNFPTVTTAATSVVIGHLAAATRTLRIGAGGNMLPNHSPYVIAEQFGTLATLFPGRIDLGLGRAPGTDPVAAAALRRDPGAAERFPQDVVTLQAYLGPVRPGQRVEAVPGSGTDVPLWILGSSLFGAELAARLGLPFGFASHFAPPALDAALALYRERFTASPQMASPYVLTGVNIVAAETDEDARRLATSQQMSFADLARGARQLLQPPIDDIDTYWTPPEKARASEMLACSIVGGPETVRRGVAAFLERTRADELMVVSDLFDFDRRLRSFEIIADVCGLRGPGPDDPTARDGNTTSH
jgi:luciferase family oxidoreductase group 1